MKVNEIERLLTRYYDGETSETEEKELKRSFTEEDVPAHNPLPKYRKDWKAG